LKKILGYSKEEVLGKSAVDYIHPDDRKLAIDAIARGKETGQKRVSQPDNIHLCSYPL